ncbi:MAG: methionine--tRNA ligase [Patescibacteria group bacterium]
MDAHNMKKFYITTPIFYANAELHLGHTYTLVLADILARYHRALEENTFFLTGMDEHGAKIVRAAQKADTGPQDFVNGHATKFQTLLDNLSISNDFFIRTSDQKHHWHGATKLWRALEESGDIYKGNYQGLYCVGCEAFVTEKELVNGKCPHHDTEPEKIDEQNYFFRLSRYTPELKRLIESKELLITPATKANEMLALLDVRGSENYVGDISISRPEGQIPWGIPVPGDPSQLMYVWCDALANYLSALGYGQKDDENFSLFWPPDVQVMGKDIIRFHALLWPAMLLSAKLALPKEILVHGFVTSGGRKMSKSIGNVLVPADFLEEYGVDALRYYFAREVAPTDDWDLTREKFKEVYNANLANGLGNLVSRTLKMAEQYFAGRVEGTVAESLPLRTHHAPMFESGDLAGFNIPYIATNNILPRYHAHMKAHEINKAADVVWEFIGKLDQYVTDYEPFKLIKTDPATAEKVIWALIYGLQEVAHMTEPFIPEASQKIQMLIGSSVAGEKEGSLVFFTKAPLAPLFMRKE